MKNNPEQHAVNALLRHTNRRDGDQVCLRLTGPQVTDLTFHHLSAEEYRDVAKAMVVASISDAKVTDLGLELLAEKIREIPIKFLNELCLVNLSVTEKGVLDVVKEIPNLRHLEVLQIPLSDGFVEQLPLLPKLSSLCFHYTGISDVTIERLSRFTALRSLETEEHLVSEEAVESLRNKMAPRGLRRLWASGLRINRQLPTANPELW